jgi:hypothetical protein
VARRGKFPRYFYLNTNDRGPLLHRREFINRGEDIIEAWCYPLGKRVAYTYSDVRERYEAAFTTPEVCKMLNRGHDHMRHAIMEGKIEPPQFTYTLDNKRFKLKYMWHESDIMKARDFYSSQHPGRSRVPKPIPTRRELRAMLRQEQVLYVKNDNGEFVPTWKAPDFS